MSDGPLLAILLALSFVGGIARQHLAPGMESAPTDIVFAIFSIFIVYWWYREDATRRGFNRSSLLSLAVALAAPIAIPYYLFRSRGARYGAVATVAFIAILVATLVMDYAGALAMYKFVQS